MRASMLSSQARRVAALVLSIGAVAFFATVASMQGPRFYPDDPIARAPESQNAANAGTRTTSLVLWR